METLFELLQAAFPGYSVQQGRPKCTSQEGPFITIDAPAHSVWVDVKGDTGVDIAVKEYDSVTNNGWRWLHLSPTVTTDEARSLVLNFARRGVSA